MNTVSILFKSKLYIQMLPPWFAAALLHHICIKYGLSFTFPGLKQASSLYRQQLIFIYEPVFPLERHIYFSPSWSATIYWIKFSSRSITFPTASCSQLLINVSLQKKAWLDSFSITSSNSVCRYNLIITSHPHGWKKSPETAFGTCSHHAVG